MRNFFFVALLLDALLIALSLFFSPLFLLNTQLAFIASLLIVMGSFWGYRRVVQKRAAVADRDAIDEIQDRFDLYDEEDRQSLSAKELFEQERAKSKKRGLGLADFVRTSSGFFSPFRLMGYLFLTIVVMVLVRKGLFEMGAFLLGLGVVPLSAMLFALMHSKDQSSM